MKKKKKCPSFKTGKLSLSQIFYACVWDSRWLIHGFGNWVCWQLWASWLRFASIDQLYNKQAERKRRVNKQQRSPACHHLPLVNHGLSKQPALSSTREVRIFPTVSASRCRDGWSSPQSPRPATSQFRNLLPLLDQGMGPFPKEVWTEAFQGVNGIKEDVVWLPRTARPSLSQHPGNLRFQGVYEAQSGLLLLQLGYAFIWLFCNQKERFNGTLLSSLRLSQQDPRRREAEGGSSVTCATGLQVSGCACLPLEDRPQHCICLLTSRCSAGG